MDIAVVGTGYVGLVTGTCLAETGCRVICVDTDIKKLDLLKNGIIPIYEPGLEPLFKRAFSQKRLSFTSKLDEAASFAQIIFLALPTPPKESGAADLSRVLSVSENLAQNIKTKKIIVNKSTVPVGTTMQAQKIFKKYGSPSVVVSNPEFLREGFAVEDFMKPDRIVVGTTDSEAREILERLYQPFVRQGNPIYFMSEESAELTKYAANSFLAMKISFMNEMARMAEKCGADIDDVRLAVGADERIGRRFLFPGIGFGGSCLPKDVQAITHMGRELGTPLRLAEAILEVNKTQIEFFLQKILSHFGNNISGRKFAIWGLSFKPDTDDVREAPALKVLEFLRKHNSSFAAFDPEAFQNAKNEFPELVEMIDMYETLKGADGLIICTEWSHFRNPDFNLIKKNLKCPVVFDGRNLYRPEFMKPMGFTYYSVGRP